MIQLQIYLFTRMKSNSYNANKYNANIDNGEEIWVRKIT